MSGTAAIEHEIVGSVADDTHMSIRFADVQGNHLIWSGDLVSGDDDAIVDYRVWLDIPDPLTVDYAQQLESAYQRPPAAPEPDTKHALD